MSDLADKALLAGIGAGFVFLGKALDKLFGWKRSREDFATRLRDELHEETRELKREIEILQKQVEEWREKYHAEKEANGRLRNDYAALRQDFDELMQKLAEAGVTP